MIIWVLSNNVSLGERVCELAILINSINKNNLVYV
jgi:hypothetical protein